MIQRPTNYQYRRYRRNLGPPTTCGCPAGIPPGIPPQSSASPRPGWVRGGGARTGRGGGGGTLSVGRKSGGLVEGRQ